jgi:hypothetical protein
LQHRLNLIVRFTQADCDILQSEGAHSLAQTPQIFRLNVFRNNAAAAADDRGEPHNVVAATRADVRDGHTGFDAKADVWADFVHQRRRALFRRARLG